jgi:hypothetical protein
MKKSISLLVMLWICLTACKKDDGNQPTPNTSKKDLISKTWKVDEVLINDVRDQTTDYSSVRFQFKSDGTYKITAVNGTVEGTWELSSNEQKLLMDKGTDDASEITILLLNETRLNLENVETSPKTGTKTTVIKLRQ